ncbi:MULTISPECIES: LPS-assembly protein LptD [unclassified Limnohabitans]|uniref:LPS-assembly protein LptD n=1 Tax=unclassified Limnohabitans TaxID=2626134 RepID=UPI000AA0C215|nr:MULTISPECIES: LPS assembly protein LptD [unclassified Limnohabitans]
MKFISARFLLLPTLASPLALGLAGAVLCGMPVGTVWAQARVDGSVLTLRSSPLLEEAVSDRQKKEAPTFVQAQQLTVRPDLDVQLQGQATIRRPGLSIRADRLDYDQTQDEVKASGDVRVSRDGSLFVGPSLVLQMDSFRGQLMQPRFELYKSSGYGDAASLVFLDSDRAVMQQVSYTTCRRKPGPEWLPEWVLKATRLTLDNEESSALAEGVQLRFQDVPLMALPAVSFALTEDRKSGLLPPLVGIDTTNGVQVSQPYYFDIAPNRDATVNTHVMSKRGVAVDTEFRYLEPDYNGQLRLNLMPSDSLRQQNRWGLSAQHQGGIETGLQGLGRIGLGLSVNRVSDDNYWRDFSRSGQVLTQRLLPSTGTLAWALGDLSMSAQVQRWQTLQDVSAPITPPYDRAPQITLRYGQWQADGMDWSIVGDTTRFEADYSRIPNSTALPRNGERSFVQAQVSRPWIRPWGFVTPKLQLHATRYQLDGVMDNGNRSANRVLPTYSLDSGLVLERETQWFGRQVVQTLEPRAFYVRTPYRDQSFLPVYDSGATDFNLSTIYSENAYVGHDRLIDNDALTLGVTSRFFDAANGAEMLRVGMAQRIRFSDQQVVLPGQTAAKTGLSDMLLGAGVRWDDRWALDATVQLNNQTNKVSRNTLQGRYSPSPYRVVNAAYRLNRDVSEQVDLGWQWPLSDLMGRRDDAAESAWTRAPGQGLGPDRWYTVGRMNFSINERRLVDSLLGFEYDGGCWLGRIAFERLQSTVSTATSRLLFQLEFIGLARVGASPLSALRNNIPRYQNLRDNFVAPSRFQNYE